LPADEDFVRLEHRQPLLAMIILHPRGFQRDQLEFAVPSAHFKFNS
jgi:hypothetical protein